MSVKLKPNDPHHWCVDLAPDLESDGPNRLGKLFNFVGTIDEVLGFADEMESEVSFEVSQFVITRGPKAKMNNQGRLARQGRIFNHSGKCGKLVT